MRLSIYLNLHISLSRNHFLPFHIQISIFLSSSFNLTRNKLMLDVTPSPSPFPTPLSSSYCLLPPCFGHRITPRLTSPLPILPNPSPNPFPRRPTWFELLAYNPSPSVREASSVDVWYEHCTHGSWRRFFSMYSYEVTRRCLASSVSTRENFTCQSKREPGASVRGTMVSRVLETEIFTRNCEQLFKLTLRKIREIIQHNPNLSQKVNRCSTESRSNYHRK